jgi:hypothetical protein
MPLLLTCDCGARFEVDDHLAGREVSCPECHQAVKAASRKPVPRLDWLALFSVALALLGAFTLVGTLAAAAAGAASLARIRRKPDALSGVGYAVTGIGLGLGLSLATLVLYQLGDRLPVGAWVRKLRLTGQLDAAGAAHVGSRDGACLLPRLPEGWGVLARGGSGDPAVDDLQQKAEFVLANPALRAYADLERDAEYQDHLILYADQLRRGLSAGRKPLLGDDDEENPLRVGALAPTDVWAGKLPQADGMDRFEWTFDLPRGGVTWRFLVRMYRKPRVKGMRPSPIYVFRVYAPRDRFQAAERELRAIADGVHFSP